VESNVTVKNYAVILLMVLVLTGLNSCGAEQEPLSTNTIQELRISNTGNEDIQNLIVVFPGSSPMVPVRVDFGNVKSGETTEYQAMPSGVYRYAAYEYTLEDRTIYQSVMDWLGEKPLQGTQFTYEISLDTTRVQGDQIQLLTVLTDNT
jgi:hypothetical protein